MNDLNDTILPQNVVYQLTGTSSPIEVLAPRSAEESRKLILYHTTNVAEARTEDMYLDRQMCE